MGGARTALFNWLWARHNDGTMILRIEDTDAARSTEASTEQIFESLRWLGIDWDEGPFFQSQRGEIYREHLRRLIDAGHAYRAFETPEELEAMRAEAQREGGDWVYDRRSLHLPKETVEQYLAEGRPFVWRLKTPPGETTVPETLMGGASECRFDNARLGDFTLTRAGTEERWGDPLYNFCCAVDDADMKITHVIRGSDHLTNTARQMLILQALGYPIPTYTHVPLIMKNNKKMSKRDEDADPRFPVSVSARRDLGYLPEATMNFIALLGWSLDDKSEIFAREELIRVFTLDGLSKSNANFDEDKYLHMNGLYLRGLAPEDLLERVRPFLQESGLLRGTEEPEWLARIVAMVSERCRLLSEFPDALRYFFEAPQAYEEKGAKKVFATDGAADTLRGAGKALASCDPFDAEHVEAATRQLAEELGVGFGKVAQPMRLALTGRMASPGLFEVILALGREESVRRLEGAAEAVQSGSIRTF